MPLFEFTYNFHSMRRAFQVWIEAEDETQAKNRAKELHEKPEPLTRTET